MQRKNGYELPGKVLLETLKAADVKVSVKHARITSDDGKFVNGEITIAIHDLPPIVPEVIFNINELDGNNGFIAGFTTRNNKANTMMRIINKDGNWEFQDYFSKEVISTDAKDVKFQIEFIRESNAVNHLPKTITPRISFAKQNFYYAELPIDFE